MIILVLWFYAVLLLGCRVSKNPLLLDSRGTNDLASITFSVAQRHYMKLIMKVILYQSFKH